MSNPYRNKTLEILRQRFGDLRKAKGSQSLFVIGKDAARIYFRYSKVHSGGRTFFGIREADLRQLEGYNSFLCFLLDDDSTPIFIPYSDFEAVFHNAEPAKDGQFKAQLYATRGTRELYVARQGRFNVEGYVGFERLEQSLDGQNLRAANTFSHSAIQTLLAAIGHMKGFDVCIPPSDVGRLDWTITSRFHLRGDLPAGFDRVFSILREIDVIWVARGRSDIEGLYEVEHSTSIYSGLLRFNDLLLTAPKLSRFSIVSNETRRDVFSSQLFRPTFRKSGLAEVCSFLEYANVADWHRRLQKEVIP